MRVLKRNIDPASQSGTVRVEAEEADDMYHLFNLIVQGDEVEASTMRNITRETKTGSVSKERIRLTLRLAVERVEFDAEQCSLRVSGKNCKENDHVKLGQYHTLTVETKHPFFIFKEVWDTVYMTRLNEAVDPAAKAEIAAIVMQDGLAHVCLVTPFMTQTRARIERRMPKKRDGGDRQAKAINSFFTEIYDAMMRFIDFSVVKVVLCGSPGFLKDDFYTFACERSMGADDKFLKHKSKFLRAHASSGHKKAIDEMLSDEGVVTQMGDVKAAKEVRELAEFYKTIGADQDRAAYGYDSVLYADEQLAIKSLLVTDRFFLGYGFDSIGDRAVEAGGNRALEGAGNFDLRAKHVALADSVREHGGQVFLFSSMHVSGQQLDNFTGCAAILRFPLPDPEEYEYDEDDEDARDAAAAADIDTDDMF